jgi:hypothetical protein
VIPRSCKSSSLSPTRSLRAGGLFADLMTPPDFSTKPLQPWTLPPRKSSKKHLTVSPKGAPQYPSLTVSVPFRMLI